MKMEIGSKSIAFPVFKYQIHISYSTPRRSTAFEWVLLESMILAEGHPEIGKLTIEQLYRNVLDINDLEHLVRPCVSSLINLHAIEIDGYSASVPLDAISLGEIQFTAIGKGLQEKGLIPGKPVLRGESVLYDTLLMRILPDGQKGLDTSPQATPIINTDGIKMYASQFSFPEKDILNDIHSIQPIKAYAWKHGNEEVSSISPEKMDVLWMNHEVRFYIENSNLNVDSEFETKELKYLVGDPSLYLSGVPACMMDGLNSAEFQDGTEYAFAPTVVNCMLEVLRNNRDIIISKNTYNWLKQNADAAKAMKNKIIIVFGAEKCTCESNTDSSITVFFPEPMPVNDAISIGSDQSVIGINSYHVNSYGNWLDIPLVWKSKYEADIFSYVENSIRTNMHDVPAVIALYFITNDSQSLADCLESVTNSYETIERKLGAIQAVRDTYPRQLDVHNVAVSTVFRELDKIGQFGSIDEFKAFVSTLLDNELFCDKKGYLTDVMHDILQHIPKVYSIEAAENVFAYLRNLPQLTVSWIRKSGVTDNIYTENYMRNLVKAVLKDEKYPDEKRFTVVEDTLVELVSTLRRIASCLDRELNWLSPFNEQELQGLVIAATDLLALDRNLKAYDDCLQTLKLYGWDEDRIVSTSQEFSTIRHNTRLLRKILSMYLVQTDDGRAAKEVFVMDTCAFLNHPDILNCFNKNDLVLIPTEVYSELDEKKNKVKMVNKSIEEIEALSGAARRAQKNIGNAVESGPAEVRVEESDSEIIPAGLSVDSNDSRIFSVALKYLSLKPTIITDDGGFKGISLSNNVKVLAGEALFKIRKIAPQNTAIVPAARTGSEQKGTTAFAEKEDDIPPVKEKSPLGGNALRPLSEFGFDEELLKKLNDSGYTLLKDLVPNCSVKDLEKLDFLNRSARRTIQAKLKVKKIILK